VGGIVSTTTQLESTPLKVISTGKVGRQRVEGGRWSGGGRGGGWGRGGRVREREREEGEREREREREM